MKKNLKVKKIFSWIEKITNKRFYLVKRALKNLNFVWEGSQSRTQIQDKALLMHLLKL